jgi:signal transduction histidine kinase
LQRRDCPDAGPGSGAFARRLAPEQVRLVNDLKAALRREQAAASEVRRLEDLVAELSAESELVALGHHREQVTAAAQTETLIELLPTLPHELSQPVTIIAGYAELLAAGRLTDQALLDACDELVEASQRLVDLALRLDRVANHARNVVGVGRGTVDCELAGE